MADVFLMLFDCFKSVFNTLESSLVISIAGVNITLMDILWGFFLTSALFTFFLVPRAGSGLGGIRNVSSYFQREARPQNKDGSKGDK